jgi:DNA-binding NarL/FixJ family response regulator
LRSEPSDVAILDLAGIRDGEAETFARAARPANLVAFAVRPTDREVLRWAERGVKGILTLEASFDDLLHAVIAAAAGECRCSPGVISTLMRQVAGAAAKREASSLQVVLTHRERQVAELLVEGHSNKEIAAQLMLGQSTVKNHVHHVLWKVQARTRGEAAARLVAAGILVSEPAGTGSPSARRG